jgi:hypothetical protein
MVSFAKKATTIRTDVEKKAGGNAGWMRGVKDGKDLRVRFLQDPEEWLQYDEHYVRSSGFFPCTNDDTCGACASDDDRTKRASTKYVAQVLIQFEAGAKDIGQVKALKIPRPLANRLIARADRNGGTLLNRDYTIIRRGNGLDTEYDVESEDKAPLDLSKYTGQWADVGAILEQQFEENALPSPIAFTPREPKGDPDAPSSIPGVGQTIKRDKPAEVSTELPDEPPF